MELEAKMKRYLKKTYNTESVAIVRAHVRGWHQRLKYAKLKKQVIARSNIAREIYETEKS
jgi:hypothetical protein